MDLKTTFPTAVVNSSSDAPMERQFTLDSGHIINMICFTYTSGPFSTPHAGIVIEQGEAQSGYFQQRGYVGNNLKDGRINPINVTHGKAYDLTLNGQVVATFKYHRGYGMYEFGGTVIE